MELRGENLIAGRWIPGRTYAPNYNPSDTCDVVGQYAVAESEDVDFAVDAARAAFAAWSDLGILERAQLLSKVASLIKADQHNLATLLAREEGKTLPEAALEVARAAQIFDFFAGECLRQSGEKLSSVRLGVDVEIVREAVGVLAAITPWNFPIAIPAWKVAPALAFGNCVLLKPSEHAPGCAHRLAVLLDEAGIPPGVFSLLMGPGAEVGNRLVSHPDIDGVTFTGSRPVGSGIAKSCAGQLKRFQLEMGGKNPWVVLDDADLDIAVACAVNGGFFSTGQRCTASSRIIAERGIYERFLERLTHRVAGLTVGNALDEGVDIGPLVSEKQLASVERYIESGVQAGASLLVGGQRPACRTRGHFLAPTLFADVPAAHALLHEEVFGPVATVQQAADLDEAIFLANRTRYGLSAGVCTRSLESARRFKREVRAGMVMVNLPTAGVDFHVPFGGLKASSFGPREQGRYAREFYSTVKTVYESG